MENQKEKGDPRPVTVPKIIAQQSTSSTGRINGMDADVHADGGFVSRRRSGRAGRLTNWQQPFVRPVIKAAGENPTALLEMLANRAENHPEIVPVFVGAVGDMSEFLYSGWRNP